MSDYIPFNPKVPETYEDRVKFYFQVYRSTFPSEWMFDSVLVTSKAELIHNARAHRKVELNAVRTVIDCQMGELKNHASDSIPIEMAILEDMIRHHTSYQNLSQNINPDDFTAITAKLELEKLYFLVIICLNLGALGMRQEFGHHCLEIICLWYRFFMEIAGDPLKLSWRQWLRELFCVNT